MAQDIKGFRQAALRAGIPSQMVEQEIAKRTGIKGWLTGGKQGLAGVGSAVGNILNLPSYALGGVLNQLQRGFGSKYGQQTDATGFGILEGIKSKRGVMTEAPETLGIDPSSTAGKILGFGVELLVPAPPIGRVLKFARGADSVSDVGKAGGLFSRGVKKAGKGLEEFGQDFAIKGYGQPKTLAKFKEKFRPAQDVISEYGLYGKDTDKLSKVINDLQTEFDDIAIRSGRQVNTEDIFNATFKKIDELKNSGFDDDLLLAKQLEKKLDSFLSANPGSTVDIGKATKQRIGYDKRTRTFATDPMLKGANQQMRDIFQENIRNAASGLKTPQGLDLAQQGRRLSELYSFQPIMEQAASKGTSTRAFPLGRMVTAAAGGQFAGAPGVLGAYALDAVANQPKVIGGISKGAQTLGKGLQSQRLTRPLNMVQGGATRFGTTLARTQAMPNAPRQTTQPTGQIVQPRSQLKPAYNNIIQQGAGTGFNPYKRVNLRTR